MIHTVKGFSIVSEPELDIFSEIPLFSLWSNECRQFELWFLSLAIWSLVLLILLLTLCDPVDCGPPCSSVHGIFQARLLKWIAIHFTRGSSQPRDRIQVSSIAVRLFSIQATGKLSSWLGLSSMKVDNSVFFPLQVIWPNNPGDISLRILNFISKIFKLKYP